MEDHQNEKQRHLCSPPSEATYNSVSSMDQLLQHFSGLSNVTDCTWTRGAKLVRIQSHDRQYHDIAHMSRTSQIFLCKLMKALSIQAEYFFVEDNTFEFFFVCIE
jgi:hypothetical protein